MSKPVSDSRARPARSPKAGQRSRRPAGSHRSPARSAPATPGACATPTSDSACSHSHDATNRAPQFASRVISLQPTHASVRANGSRCRRCGECVCSRLGSRLTDSTQIVVIDRLVWAARNSLRPRTSVASPSTSESLPGGCGHLASAVVVIDSDRSRAPWSRRRRCAPLWSSRSGSTGRGRRYLKSRPQRVEPGPS